MYLHTSDMRGLFQIVKFTVSELSFRRRSTYSWLLAFFWIAGLITGIFLALRIDASVISFIYAAVHRPASIVSLLLTTSLPFLFSAIAVFISKPGLLPVFAFSKTAAFSLVSLMTLRTFGTAGWMIRCMVMFADICTLPFFYSFCQRHICGSSHLSIFDGSYLIASILICSLDFYCISPFFTEVLQY